MTRVALYCCLILSSCLTQAHSSSELYQIDMIVFTHQSPSDHLTQHENHLILAPDIANAIPLQYDSDNSLVPYRIRTEKSSELTREYWALNHKTNYQVLAHMTWLQPGNSQRAVSLPSSFGDGWSIQGTVRVRQSNYYLLDTDILFSSKDNSKSAFMFSQKQRLKPRTVYYLDHPQAGMLIKVHKLV